MATQIELKVAKLKAAGFNLGQKLTNEVDAEYGGFYQRFQNATIYWHSIMGEEAHVVQGGILTKYNSSGAFGVDLSKGKRLFGFPMTDETKTKDAQYPVTYFELGAIYWRNGGVALYGKLYKHWKEMEKGSEASWLGYPLADPIKLAGGEAVFFEFGCLWYGARSNHEVVEIALNIPQLGNPWMIKSSEFSSKYMAELSFNRGIIGKEDAGKLLQDHFNGRIFLKETGTDVQLQVNINIESLNKEEKSNNIGKYSAPFSVLGNAGLKNRQLYDVCMKLPNNEMYVLSPHCIYIVKSWTDFKFIHAADLHVSIRLDGWRKILKEKGFDRGAQLFNNFNDNFREFIRYANKLHTNDELDFILITGDLIDYIFEDGGNIYQNNNFVFFRKVVLGTAGAPDRETAEELKVPIFTSLGNHDYRTHAYYPRAQVDLLINQDLPSYNHSFNLIKDEAIAVGGNRLVSKERAALMVTPDDYNKKGFLDYYFRYINKKTTYSIELDSHRILMIDGKWDADPIDTLWEAVKGEFFSFISVSDDQEQFKTGSPNSVGIFQEELDLLRSSLNNKGGLLIIGVHNPLVNLNNGEYPHFLRESIRNNELHLKESVRKYLYRRDPKGFEVLVVSPTGHPLGSVLNLSKDIHKDWSQSNTPYFASGDGKDMLDFGIMSGENKFAFLKLCAGVDVSRPADLILSGHIHDNLECRMKWDSSNKKFFFYTDFYTENPEFYYNACDIDIETDKNTGILRGEALEKKKTIFRQMITNDAKDNESLTRDKNDFFVLRKKEYSNSLKNVATTSEAVKAWWENIRPLLIQTEAIGPMKSQRGDGPQQPIFNGCRHLTVIDNLIHKIRYDRKEDITNRLSGAGLFPTQNKWLEPVLHMMMR